VSEIRRIAASQRLYSVSVFHAVSEPIREDWIHDEAFAARRLSKIRIMARQMGAGALKLRSSTFAKAGDLPLT